MIKKIYTPGPWNILPHLASPITTIDKDGRAYTHQGWWITANRNGKKTVIGEASFDTGHVGMGSVDNLFEAQANTKLIAAAPDLVETLVRVWNHSLTHLSGDMEALVKSTLTKAGVQYE